MTCHCQTTRVEEHSQEVLLRLDRIESLLMKLNEERGVATASQQRRREQMRAVAGKVGRAMLQKVVRELLAKDTGMLVMISRCTMQRSD